MTFLTAVLALANIALVLVTQKYVKLTARLVELHERSLRVAEERERSARSDIRVALTALADRLRAMLGTFPREYQRAEDIRRVTLWGNHDVQREERERAEKVVPPTPSVAVTRHLTTAQRAALPNARSVGMVAGCELTLSFTHTSETEQYAREVGAALQEAGWPLLSSPFLNWADKATDVNHPVAVVGHPADPAAEALVMALKKAGVEIPWRRDANRQTCHIELQIDDVGPR